MRRSGINIMGKLIGLVKPLLHIMLITITMGVLGFLASIFITIYGGVGLASYLGFSMGISMKKIFTLLIIFAVSRGLLRYLEQYTGHYIAFKLLAILRDKIFKKLRDLSPAKLEGEERGNLISLITSDIELLEVFYAHTIAPISIGFLTSIIMVIYIGRIHAYLALVSVIGYFTIGFIIPYFTSKIGREAGMKYRNSFGKMNSFVLDSLKGMKEIIMFNLGDKRLKEINSKGEDLNLELKKIKNHEGIIRGLNDASVLGFISIMLFTSMYLFGKGEITFDKVIVSTIAMASSFGPVLALSNLSNNLVHTLACGDRVLNLLEEEPAVIDVTNGEREAKGALSAEDLSFKYDDNYILENVNLELEEKKVYGIVGESGSGKSTLLKLFMRFWDVTKGKIVLGNKDIRNINTEALRNTQSFVTQETFLFNDTIEENIKLGKKDATIEEVIEAAKKASIDDFIMSLPKGYKTKVGELGDNLSGGERQRLGIARAFLHNGDMLLLDEPTSNLDSLNEKVILKSIEDYAKDKTVILVSHRLSTVGIADEVYKVEHTNVSKIS
ncbi:ABC transporter ATP-binding protein [Hathewaya histolytica]|uniref:ABC transporter n=1 Tax=Hathewaya histolytica TaxID=1498 RepID=A0A4U9QZL1_HATHI|nr:ABC transporter ATP-binding protein [Hathewaya histolytica]VTQ84394.1 ABC transporter [Hathewaya histolytica]